MTEVHINCPHCGSEKVFSWVATHTVHCNDCMYEWEELRIHPIIDVCDFCSDRAIVKDYACESFEAFNIGVVRGNSSGRWAACAECAKLIDTNEWEALATRSLDTMLREQKLDPDPTERAVLMGFVRNLHKEFRERRLRAN